METDINNLEGLSTINEIIIEKQTRFNFEGLSRINEILIEKHALILQLLFAAL